MPTPRKPRKTSRSGAAAKPEAKASPSRAASSKPASSSGRGSSPTRAAQSKRASPSRPAEPSPPASGELEHGFDPAATVPALSDKEFTQLCRVGKHWESVVGHHDEWRQALPVRSNLVAAPRQRGRYTDVQFARGDAPDELLATGEALEPETALGRLGYRVHRAIVGPPLRSAAVHHERLRKLIALPILSADALSSVAYGPEAMLTVLVVAGTGALSRSIPIAFAIGVLMLAVGLSYRQTVRAYPNGGGSYTVASENLGELAGLFAAAGLMVDYVLTVAVSIASGIAAVTSAIPSVASATVVLGIVVLVAIFAINMRGLREAGAVFAAPTYLFVLAIFLIVGVGFVDAAQRHFHAPPTRVIHGTEALGFVLVLRAFSSGATAMTGIEAISNAVPAFQPPSWRNARTTLSWMIGLLITMFAGIIALVRLDGLAPEHSQTILSQLAHRSVGSGMLYGFVQATTALILLLAANTAFNGFPRLLYFMARNRHAPALFLRMGDRLAFSNGMLVLAVLAGVLFAAFGGNTEALIPLYAVGVFLAFTLSQSGMVVLWLRTRSAGWRRSIGFNAVGAVLSGIVLVISGATKFTEGAWVVVIAVPLLVLAFLGVRNYYAKVRAAIALGAPGENPALLVPRRRIRPTSAANAAAATEASATAAQAARTRDEKEQSPDELHHFAIVPVAALDRASMRALAYAASLAIPVLALHISPSDEEAKRFEEYWKAWGDHLPLEIVVSPYRAIVVPLARYVQSLHYQREDVTITVVIPELVPAHAWQRFLHAGISARVRRALQTVPRIVVTTVPFHLPA
jgi:amino acid transporter